MQLDFDLRQKRTRSLTKF